MDTPQHPVVIVAGPTASGKSALAIDLARAFDGVIINADSMQVYRELHILTARPGLADEALAPHRLYGVLSAGEPCSAGRWLDMASGEVQAAWAAGRLPIVTGGTGLYIKALKEGMAPIPAVPNEVRAAVRALYADGGIEAVRGALARLDSPAAEAIKDPQRLMRALEVVRATDRPLADWQAEAPAVPALPQARFATLAVMPQRPVLYARCEQRFDAMIEAGALDEVRALAGLGLAADLPAMKALGVPDLLDWLAGRIALETAVERAKTATRRFAKRQCTWLRNQEPAAHFIDPGANAQHSESMKEEIFSFIRHFLLTGGA